MKTLKELRKQKGLSVEELSSLTGVQVSMIRKYEGGFKDINSAAASTVYKLALSLGCDITDIIETEQAKSDVYKSLAALLADMEMDSATHADDPEDYNSPLDYYLSNVELDSYREYLLYNWVSDESSAADLQEMVIDEIRGRV